MKNAIKIATIITGAYIFTKTVFNVGRCIGEGYGIGYVSDYPSNGESDLDDAIDHMKCNGFSVENMLTWAAFIAARKEKKMEAEQ